MNVHTHRLQPYIRGSAIVLLGVLIPIIVLVQAYAGLDKLTSEVRQEGTTASLVETFKAVKHQASAPDDYRLFSLLYSEHANQKTMINKQVLKVSIMQIGFAVVSVGMMFIVLGIRDGGATGTAEGGGLSFNFKVGSTGVLMILVGAAMSTAGGVLRNEYNTVPIPLFGGSAGVPEAEGQLAQSIEAYKTCKREAGDEKDKCFINLFEQINFGERR